MAGCPAFLFLFKALSFMSQSLLLGGSQEWSLSSSSWPFPYHLLLPLPGFSLIHLVATGVSCFLGSGLLTLAVYLSCQHCQRQSQESTLVHPATPNHLHYKGGGTPKNEKYTPMEFKVGGFIEKLSAG